MKSLLLFLVVATTSAFGISGENWVRFIPEETQFELRFDVKVLANAAAAYLAGDFDLDGVPDYEDYCPRTPAGSVVWTKDTIATGDKKNVGCAGGSIEASSGAVTRNETTCTLEITPFNKERILHAGTVMSLVSVTGEAFYDQTLKLRTAKGTDLTFRCRNSVEAAKVKHIENFFKLTFPAVEDITMR